MASWRVFAAGSAVCWLSLAAAGSRPGHHSVRALLEALDAVHRTIDRGRFRATIDEAVTRHGAFPKWEHSLQTGLAVRHSEWAAAGPKVYYRGDLGEEAWDGRVVAERITAFNPAQFHSSETGGLGFDVPSPIELAYCLHGSTHPYGAAGLAGLIRELRPSVRQTDSDVRLQWTLKYRDGPSRFTAVLDPARSYMIAEWHESSKSDEARLRVVSAQRVGGVWLPTHIERTAVRRSGGRIVGSERLSVVYSGFASEVADALFELRAHPGDVVMGAHGEYVLGPHGEHLPYSYNPSRPIPPDPSEAKARLIVGAFACSMVALGVAWAAVNVIRTRRRSR